MATLTRRVQVVEERTESLETILAAFMARTDVSMARMDVSMARMDASMARMDASMARTDEAMARTDEAMARTDEAMVRTNEAMARTDDAITRTNDAMTRTDERIGRLERVVDRREQEGAREREEAARERKEMNKRMGELSNKMGTIVEDIVAPSIRRLAREVFGCGDLQHFAARTVRTRSDDRSREREFDALYVGRRAVLLNETKASARPEYAHTFVRFLESGQFARYFPEYRELPIVPVFSSLSIPADVVTYLTRRGIYAVAMGDEAMQVLNLDEVLRRSPAR